jgi:hypothetical protein
MGTLLGYSISILIYRVQGCTDSLKFSVVAPNTCGSLVWKLRMSAFWHLDGPHHCFFLLLFLFFLQV